MAKGPNVLTVAGGQRLLRTRLVDEIIRKKAAEGWAIDYVPNPAHGALSAAMDGGFFQDGRKLIIVSSPEKADLGLLKEHLESGDDDTVILLHIEGEPDGRTKFGKFVKANKKGYVGFPLPKEWDAPDVAAKFIHEEMKRYGKTIPDSLVIGIVNRVGTDLGVLSFELWKFATLADVHGVSEITRDEIVGAMAAIAEAEVGPVLDALSIRHPKNLSVALGRIRAGSRHDPTIRICRLMGAVVMKWFQAAHLDSVPAEEAARGMGVNPWYFKNRVRPVAARWGREGTVRLIRDLAVVERAVLNGAVDPWILLVSRLLLASSSGPQ